MSLPMLQACWDHNRRLYQEMTASSIPRTPPNQTPLGPPQRTPQPRLLDNTRSSAPSLPRTAPAAPSTYRTAPAPYDRRITHPASRTGLPAAEGPQSQSTPTQKPPAPHSTMPPPNIPDPIPQISYYIRSEHPTNIHHKPLPPYISQGPQTLPPPSPSLRQILNLAPPFTSLIKFGCGCLNLGICIHYQIIFRRDHLPDGLICPACQDPKTQQAIVTAKRKCPGHVDDSGTEKKHVSSRPEDFLPSEEQKSWYADAMSRLTSRKWDASIGGMGERGIESARARMQGIARMRPPTKAAGGMAATATGMATGSRGAAPGPRREHGQAPAPTMQRPTIEALPDSRQLSTEPIMLPPPAWPVDSPVASPIPASIPAQTVSQTFFTNIPATPPQASIHSIHWPPPPFPRCAPPPPHILSQLHAEALADDAALALRIENRRMGIPNADDSDEEMVTGNLRRFENGWADEPNATLGMFSSGSGMDEL